MIRAFLLQDRNNSYDVLEVELSELVEEVFVTSFEVIDGSVFGEEDPPWREDSEELLAFPFL